jgi:phosphoribosylformylglycinamidine synthase
MVRTNTVVGPGGDAAVVRLRGTDRALALKTDCNGRYVYLDPRTGGQAAVVEAARNVACAGGRPRAITNNLNFGSPKRPEVFFQFREAVAGMGEACEALETPVTGGNVSFYNESPISSVYPTPVVGMVGELPVAARAGRLGFVRAGDAIALIAASGWAPSLAGSELAKLRGAAPDGELPVADLGELRAVHAAIRQAVRSGALHSAHDVAEGGLAVALAECCIAGGRGAEVSIDAAEHALFGEGPGAFVVSGAPDAFAAFGAAVTVIGVVGGDELRIAGALSLPVGELSGVHAGGLAALMG